MKTSAHEIFVNSVDIGMRSCFPVVEETFEITSNDDWFSDVKRFIVGMLSLQGLIDSGQFRRLNT